MSSKCKKSVFAASSNTKLICILVLITCIIILTSIEYVSPGGNLYVRKLELSRSNPANISANNIPPICNEVLRIANITEHKFSMSSLHLRRMSTLGCSYITPRGNVSLEYLVPQGFCSYKEEQLNFLKDVANHHALNFTGPILFMSDDDGTLSCETEKAVYDSGGIVFSHSHLKTGFDCYEKYVVFQPDYHFIPHHGFVGTIRDVRKMNTSYFDRIPQVFWRGVTTSWLSNNCSDLPRVRLCRRANGMPWVDAKITNCVQICSDGDSCKRIEYLRGGHKKESDWVKHRGILDIDGNVNAWGLFWRLASGSVVFRVESEYTNFYTQQMVPWQHYIPISRDLSDLGAVTKLVTLKPSSRRDRRRKEVSVRGNEIVDYARILREPAIMESIAQNAFDFTQQFTYEKVVEQVVNQLNKIQLQRSVEHDARRGLVT